jgi:hypothetical protein
MFSVTSTGTCCRPLCTAIVSPTISGMTIERRDQVLIGLRSFFAAAASHLLGEVQVDERALLQRTWHCSS